MFKTLLPLVLVLVLALLAVAAVCAYAATPSAVVKAAPIVNTQVVPPFRDVGTFVVPATFAMVTLAALREGPQTWDTRTGANLDPAYEVATYKSPPGTLVATLNSNGRYTSS